MGVSVVVPTVDRVQLLDRCLRAIAAQLDAPDEVIVVHDGHCGIAQLLDAWDERLPLRVLHVDDRGASAKRNAGWRAAQHELVAFTDDDCAPTPSWISALRQVDADLVAGPIAAHPDDPDDCSVFGRTIEVAEPGSYFPAANIAVRRSALAAVGGFDLKLSGGEDTDLAWRVREAGGAVGWAADALVLHAIRPVTFPQHLRSLWRWHDLPLLLRRHPQLRDTLDGRVFWKSSHPLALLAVAGVVGAFGKPALALLAVPLLSDRWRARGPRFGTQVAIADAVEVAVVLTGSVRHRSLLL